MARSNVAILYVGGSIGMTVNTHTGRIEPIESVEDIYKHIPNVQQDVRLTYFTVATLGSSDITVEHWHAIAQKITEEYQNFDGFVVIHGTNTMAYTASAIAFALQGLSKPIIFTGAILPLNSSVGDGRFNLTHAIMAATLNIAEVCIVMEARIFRAVRTRKVSQTMFNTFASHHLEPIGEINSLDSLADWRQVRRKRTLESAPEFTTNVASVNVFPSINEQILYTISEAQPKGIIVHAYGPGMVPASLFNWLESLKAKSIPVLFVTQTVQGEINFESFSRQLELQSLHVLSAKNMTPECATVKFMWALSHFERNDHLKSFMERSIVGELD